MGEIFIKVKIIFTALVILVFLGMACVSTEENQTNLAVDDFGKDQEIVTADNDDTGSFTELKTKITESGNELKLEKDYKYITGADLDTVEGIEVGKSNYVIDGQGHTIDGSTFANLFIFYGSNITVKNLKMINMYSEKDIPAGLFFQNGGVIDNCTFENNDGMMNGGAIRACQNDATTLIVKNSKFINNKATYGGAIYI